MQKINFTAEERKNFQEGIRKFIKQTDQILERDNKNTEGGKWTNDELTNVMNTINYQYKLCYGSGHISSERTSIAFSPKSFLGENFVNGKQVGLNRGIYIWFAYYYESKDYVLGFAISNENGEEKAQCQAYRKMIEDDVFDSKWYEYSKLDLEKITDNFLELVNYFSKFQPDNFKTENTEYYKDDNHEFQTTDRKHGKTPATIPLNQILYGSPGTGKTYSTIDKALEILGVDVKSKNRQELKTLFKDYKSRGQIEFVTFHQNYGYEEFVEGIKPKLDIDNNGGDLKYKIQEGVFKKICNNAGYIQEEIDNFLIDTKSRVWKISLGGKNWKDKTKELQEYCFKHNEIRIGWEDASINEESFEKLGSQQKSAVLQFKKEMQIGDLVCVLNSKTTIMAIGIIESNFYYDNKSELAKKLEDFYSSRKVKWIDQSINEIYSLNNETELTLKTVYPLTEISPINLLSLIQNKQSENIIDNTNKPYILIIDEINRGNISKIFGELITLIEPSKRIGAEEELRVTLPYSQESFGVPSNLYIIGTMNTADRSITSLDTALRRRFEFVEMMPDATKLGTFVSQGKTIDLQKILTAINERIEFLYDREKTIGHAYLLDIKNLDKLKGIFQNKIIPLLQEYFYNDYEAIQAVLNDNGMVIPKQANKQKEQSDFIASNGFKNLVNDRGLEEKRIFKIAPKDSLNENGENLWDDPQTYINIYEG